MRKVLLLLCIILSSTTLTSCKKNKSNEVEQSSEDVYICTGPQSKRYHCDEMCKGLSRCSGEIKCVTKSEAEDDGKTPCHMCY